LSRPQDSSTNGLSVVTLLSPNTSDSESSRAPYTATRSTSIDAALSTPSESPYPPPFSSLYFPSRDSDEQRNKTCETSQDESPPAFAAAPPFTASSSSAAASAAAAAAAETKAALPRDTKDGSSSKDIDDGEPPPPYSEGDSPLDSFTYLMASAGGPASIITQVSQTSVGPPINTLGGSDENITLELRYIMVAHLRQTEGF
jgi:ATP-binding cassette subfamily F protein 3